jgi:hypothetical protein
MVTITEARELIYEEFLGSYAAIPSARITADNEQFDPPAGLSWGRFSVRHTGRSQESLGGVGRRKFTSRGSAFFQIFSPQDQGLATVDGLAQAAREVLEGISLSGNDIRFTDCDVRELGPDQDGWFGMTVEASFEYTETK